MNAGLHLHAGHAKAKTRAIHPRDFWHNYDTHKQTASYKIAGFYKKRMKKKFMMYHSTSKNVKDYIGFGILNSSKMG